MICPLLAIATPGDLKLVHRSLVKCLEGGCAWWEPKIGKCSVLRMWIALQDIHEVLHDLVKKMPDKDRLV